MSRIIKGCETNFGDNFLFVRLMSILVQPHADQFIYCIEMCLPFLTDD